MIDKNQPFRFDVVWLGKTEFYVGINGQHTVDCAEVEPGLYGFFSLGLKFGGRLDAKDADDALAKLLTRLPGILTSITNPIDGWHIADRMRVSVGVLLS